MKPSAATARRSLARQQAGRVGIVIVLNNLIRVLVAQGELDQARQFAIECLPLARDEKVGVDLLDATVGLASRLGEHAAAARFWGAADQTLLAWGYRHQPVNSSTRRPCSRIRAVRSAMRPSRPPRRPGAHWRSMRPCSSWSSGWNGGVSLGQWPRVRAIFARLPSRQGLVRPELLGTSGAQGWRLKTICLQPDACAPIKNQDSPALTNDGFEARTLGVSFVGFGSGAGLREIDLDAVDLPVELDARWLTSVYVMAGRFLSLAIGSFRLLLANAILLHLR